MRSVSSPLFLAHKHADPTKGGWGQRKLRRGKELGGKCVCVFVCVHKHDNIGVYMLQMLYLRVVNKQRKGVVALAGFNRK